MSNISFANGGEHPAVSEAKATVARLEGRTAPGYPLGYILETTEVVCGGCGSRASTSRLMVITRKGSDSKAFRPTGASEVVYDLPTEVRKVYGGTARCLQCVETLPRLAVPRLPPPQAKLHNNAPPKAGVEIDLDELFGGKI